MTSLRCPRHHSIRCKSPLDRRAADELCEAPCEQSPAAVNKALGEPCDAFWAAHGQYSLDTYMSAFGEVVDGFTQRSLADPSKRLFLYLAHQTVRPSHDLR